MNASQVARDPGLEHWTVWCQWGLRWLWLTAVPLALFTSDAPAGPLLVLFAGYAALQIVFTVALLRGHGLARRAELGLVVDAGFGLAIIGIASLTSLAWVGLLLPAASAGCRSGLGGALRSSGFVMVLAGIGLGWQHGSLAIGMTEAGLHGLLVVPTGSLMGAVAHRMVPAAAAAALWERTAQPEIEADRPALSIQALQQPGELLDVMRAQSIHLLTASGLAPATLATLSLRRSEEGWIVNEADRDPVEFEIEETGREAGLLSAALASSAAQAISQPSRDPQLSQLHEVSGWGSAACLPLHDGVVPIGLLLLGHENARAFGPERLRRLQAIVREARLAARYSRLFRALQQERDRMTEVQEEARKKLARDLHDGPTQTIAAIAMRTNFARRELRRDTGAAEEELEKVERMARQTTKEIRHMLFTLRPLILESQGLEVALHQFAQKVYDTHKQQVWVEAERQLVAELAEEHQGMLFYIAEEAVTNARKHAAAENVWIRLLAHDDRVALEVEDDGVGFNIGEVDAHYEQRGSLGMVTMRERAELMGGDFQIESEEGRGTLIRVVVDVGAGSANEAPTAGADPA